LFFFVFLVEWKYFIFFLCFFLCACAGDQSKQDRKEARIAIDEEARRKKAALKQQQEEARRGMLVCQGGVVSRVVQPMDE